MRRPALEDGARDERPRGGRPEQRTDAHRPRRLAEDRDVARIAAEGRDVIAHEAQRGQLILEAEVHDVLGAGHAEQPEVREAEAPRGGS